MPRRVEDEEEAAKLLVPEGGGGQESSTTGPAYLFELSLRHGEVSEAGTEQWALVGGGRVKWWRDAERAHMSAASQLTLPPFNK